MNYHSILYQNLFTEVSIDKTKTFCPVAGCDGVCKGIPGVAQQSECKEVWKHRDIVMS